jgi:hypothetical protein
MIKRGEMAAKAAHAPYLICGVVPAGNISE